jgi:hypothetical protein
VIAALSQALLHRVAKAALVDIRTSGGIEVLADELDAARKRARRATVELRQVEADEAAELENFRLFLQDMRAEAAE